MKSGSRSILSAQRRLGAVDVLLVLPGQSEKTPYQIFVFGFKFGIVNIIRSLAERLS
jgi:hypothetical protein